jgi:hypothetical protein
LKRSFLVSVDVKPVEALTVCLTAYLELVVLLIPVPMVAAAVEHLILLPSMVRTYVLVD